MDRAPNARTESVWWLTDSSGRTSGPLTLDHLLERLRAGHVRSDALICEVGTGEWRRIPDVARFLEGSEAPPDDCDPFLEVTAVAVPRPSNAPPPGLLSETDDGEIRTGEG